MALWNKVPKFDAAFSQVSKSTDLFLEDMGILKDPMDKGMVNNFKRAWQSMGNLKPAMKTTCVSRNKEYCLNQISKPIHPSKKFLTSFTILSVTAAYISDASTESKDDGKICSPN